MHPRSLDLTADVVALAGALVDIESVSRNEQQLADLIEAGLADRAHLDVTRVGNSLVARTDLGRPQRVVIAGHVDTVPVNDNLPGRNDGTHLHGLGSCDMKGGLAVALRLAATLDAPRHDVTYVFYECEEIDAVHNGLRAITLERPDLVEADFAILMEPSSAAIEAGCQGSLRVEVRTHGERAHSARAWKGVNAIHAAEDILRRLNSYQPRRPVIDGLEFHEGLNAVLVSGGIATNVIPDECVVTVNHRFAPDRTEDEALDWVREFFDGYDVTLTDTSPGARPGLDVPAAREFVEAVGGPVSPKFGWTDVSRFTALGVPAVNYGPGDSSLAHTREERVPVEEITRCEDTLARWLGER